MLNSTLFFCQLLVSGSSYGTSVQVSDLHTVALLTGGPQAQLKGAAVETAAKGQTVASLSC